MTGKLPPLRYWRARTAEDKLRSRRDGLVPAVGAAMALMAALLLVSSLLGHVYAWLWYGAAIVEIVVVGSWLELRHARRRQAEDGGVA